MRFSSAVDIVARGSSSELATSAHGSVSRSAGYQWNGAEARLALERGVERQLEQLGIERPPQDLAHRLGVVEVGDAQIVLRQRLLGGREQLQAVVGRREHVDVGAAQLAPRGIDRNRVHQADPDICHKPHSRRGFGLSSSSCAGARSAGRRT